MQPLLNKKQMAEFCGCSEAHIDRLRRNGKLRAVKLGKLVMFDEAAIRSLADSCREPDPVERRDTTTQNDLAAAMARGEAAMRGGRPARSSQRA